MSFICFYECSLIHKCTQYDLFFGILFGIVGSLWLIAGNCDNESFKHWQIYPVVVFLGISFSMVKISTLSLVSDMIGRNKVSGSDVRSESCSVICLLSKPRKAPLLSMER